MSRSLVTIGVVLLLALAPNPATALVTPAGAPTTPALPNDADPRVLTAGDFAAFEDDVAEMLARTGVPGASVAVVQDGEVAFLAGFGVTEAGGETPVTPDTLLMVGSVTKAMTATMAATAIDDGLLTWETPVVDLLPGFALADPALTRRVSLRDAFCACAGLPRQDLALLFADRDTTPEAMIASLAGIAPTVPFGERFQYNNQVYAVGGYAAALAAGGNPDDLGAAYATAMQERILDPVGMPRSTFDLGTVLADGDFARPHGGDLAGGHRPIPPADEADLVSAVAPAGGLWSSAREMARFLQTELANGVAPGGVRVVSAENLAATWESQIAIPSDPTAPPVFSESARSYGQGWVVGTYARRRLLSHGGRTNGFAAQVAFLPDADLGLVVLTNGRDGDLLGLAAQFRLLELAFGRPDTFGPIALAALEDEARQRADLAATLSPLDPEAAVPLVGNYAHPALGQASVSLRDGRLLFEAGLVGWELRPVAGERATFVFFDGPLAGVVPVRFEQREDEGPTLLLTVPGDGGDTYAFTPIAAPSATPPRTVPGTPSP